MKTTSIIVLSFVLISCTSTTKSLWKDPTYKEKIASFLITNDGKKLAIIGNKYHYIFELENSLRTILLSNKRNQLKPLFYSFNVDKNNSISGKYILKFSTKKQSDIKEIKELGFKNKTYSNGRKNSTYTFSGSINGRRYSTNKNINAHYKFNKPYTITVKEPPTFIGNVGKTLATPIAVAADGVKTIAGIILIPIYAIILTNKY